MLAAVVRRWDWRISAHARLASLAAAWILLLLASAPAAILLPLAAVRFISSPIQLALNHHLSRRHPLDKRDGLDWALFAVAFVASMAVSAIRPALPGFPVALLFATVLLPLSVIQLRATARSYRAHRREFAIQDSRLTVVRPAEEAFQEPRPTVAA